MQGLCSAFLCPLTSGGHNAGSAKLRCKKAHFFCCLLDVSRSRAKGLNTVPPRILRHRYIRTYMYTYIYMYIHTYIHTDRSTYMHTYIHACIHAYIQNVYYICVSAHIFYIPTIDIGSDEGMFSTRALRKCVCDSCGLGPVFSDQGTRVEMVCIIAGKQDVCASGASAIMINAEGKVKFLLKAQTLKTHLARACRLEVWAMKDRISRQHTHHAQCR